MRRPPRRCERCGAQLYGRWHRCLACGLYLCDDCIPRGYSLCWVCWDTEDGREADRDEPSYTELAKKENGKP